MSDLFKKVYTLSFIHHSFSWCWTCWLRISTYKYDHDDKSSQVGGSGHPHADKAVMFSRHHVSQEPCTEPDRDLINLGVNHNHLHLSLPALQHLVNVSLLQWSYLLSVNQKPTSVLGVGNQRSSGSIMSVGQQKDSGSPPLFSSFSARAFTLDIRMSS